MNPDDMKLALWLDDEMPAEDLAAFEASMDDPSAQIAAREEIRAWRTRIASALPPVEEPPYPDFFNSRVARTIQESAAKPAVVARSGFSWRSLLMPMAACAGMVLAFWIGSRRSSTDAPAEIVVEGAPKAIPVEPILYTPERGVKAEWFASSDASATVIVLNGVSAIPDSMDFSETAGIGGFGELDSTAGTETDVSGESSL